MKKFNFVSEYLNTEQLNKSQLVKATWETLYMTSVSMILVIILGLILGLMLFYLKRKQGVVAQVGYSFLSFFSNICRSIPFIILIVLLIPITRSMIGTFLGPTAAIPALVISATPFFGRLVEIALREVSEGVLEAADAMGATKRQTIFKILLPESLPAILSGVTVTTITMIGFTAMAGAINAGGLGGLAYQDGFMRNNLTVTFVATILILVLVFIIQGLGDSLVAIVDKRQKITSRRPAIVWGSLAILFLTLLVGVSGIEGASSKENVSLKVGASPTPHAEILEYIRPQLLKEGITLEIVKFDDYILPNKSLAEKAIDANYFQHEPFYDLAVSENNYQFSNQGPVHIELMGLYSKRMKASSELKKGATIMVSNSESDWGRVITILETKGLIKVAKGVELATATFEDIVENPLELKFIHTVNPELLTQAYDNDEADLIAINANFASTIGLSPTVDSILVEKEKSPYANILVSRKDNQQDKAIKALVKALHSETTQSWIKKEWDGKIQPVDLKSN